MDAMDVAMDLMAMLFKKNKSNGNDLKVEWWTTVPGLSKMEEVIPRKQSKFLPEWWKGMKYDENNVRQCPSFPQMFSTSYILPMWCDTKFTRNGNMFQWETANSSFSWGDHTDEQFLQYAPEHFRNKFFTTAKAISPWRVKTPKGYSLYQMPAQWHFNEKFTVATGIIDSDYFHEANPQLFLSLKDGESFLLKRGTPLAVYFPFKREKFDLVVREKTDEDNLDESSSFLIHTTKFINAYRSHQKFLDRVENDSI